MANTSKLNLPLIDATATADVPRDMNALANGIDAKAGAAGGLATLGADGKVPAEQLNVTQPPDASTTTKGVTQLNDTVTSTSKTQAATANAAKTAYDRGVTAENNAKTYTDSKVNRVDITANLGPGTSVITADQASDVDLTFYGMTRNDILGNIGNFENDSNNDGVADGWSKAGTVTITQDSSIYLYGTKSTKMVIGANGRQELSTDLILDQNKKYILIAEAYISAYTDGSVAVVASDSSITHSNPSSMVFNATTLNKWQLKFLKITGRATLGITLGNYSSSTNHTVNFDGIGLFEVPDDLYARIGVDITEDNIRDFLPHVDGKQHVNGVIVTKQGKNLIPGILDSLNATAKINGLYDVTLNPTAPGQYSSVEIPVAPNTKYTVRVEVTGDSNARWNVNTVRNSSNNALFTNQSATATASFTTDANTRVVYLNLYSNTAGTYGFKNWMLTPGDTVGTFEPADPQRLILPVTLASTPDGSVRDTAYYRDGAWRLMKRVDTSVDPAVALAKPVESVISKAEGAITLHPGGNQITVETGVIQREKVTFNASTKQGTTSKRSARVIGVYKGANPEPFTTYISGGQTLPQLVNAVESGKDYFVTYVALDKYALTANVTQTDAKYVKGIDGTMSNLVRDVAQLTDQNSRQDAAETYIQAVTENNRFDLNNSIGYGVTTNSGNAYSVTLKPVPSSLVAGLRIAVKINAASTGAPTLNPNGLGAISILKANGNPASLKQGGVYTMVYDGSAFILQGEGGDYGTVTAADVRSTKTFGTDDGPKPGTLVTQATQAQTITPGVSNIVKPAGIYDGAITILGDPDLIAANFPNDVNIFGIQGILERLTTTDRNAIIAAIVAKGVGASSSDTNAQLATKIGQINTGKRYATGTGPLTGINVTGLAFNPTVIVVFADSSGDNNIGGLYVARNAYGNASMMNINFYVFNQIFGTNVFTVTSNGFTFSWTHTSGTALFRWIAFE